MNNVSIEPQVQPLKNPGLDSLRSANSALPDLSGAPDLVDQVYNALVKAISSGLLAPSFRCTQEQLAAQFGISRQPVLQALRLLKRDGLVQDAPGRGLQIVPLQAEVIAWVYQLRSALDALAAELASLQSASIDPKLIEAGRYATAERDLPGLIEADMAFHQAIYKASGNPMIVSSAKMHWCHIQRAMGEVLRGESIRRSVWDEHEAIAEAVSSGDAIRARRLASSHGHEASAFMISQLLKMEHTNETEQGAVSAI